MINLDKHKVYTDKLKKEIVDVLQYQDGNYYVGGLAVAHVAHILEGHYGDNISTLLKYASEDQVTKAHNKLKCFIDHMKKHPRN